MERDVTKLINPESIAVVGATSRPQSVGLAVFSNLIYGGYQGVIYPVNQRAKSVLGVKSYPTLLDIPDEIDVVVMVVPAAAVNPNLKMAIEKKAKGAIVVTAGFKEVGPEGAKMEKEMQEICRAGNLPLVGPNCLGILNTDPKIMANASFATKMPRPGNLAFISQSGALCTAVLDVADGRNMGFSKILSFGNKADVTEIDLLRYLRDDPLTKVILMYLEDISDGQEFIKVAREIAWEAKKPLLAIKSGRSAEGAKAASSHTGSLAGSDASYDAIFTQAGVMRVNDVNELFDFAQVFSAQPMPKGNRLAIITNAGGPGIMATDAAVRYGLSLGEISGDTKANLVDHLPDTASLHNPIDVIGDATAVRYQATIKTVLEDKDIDMVQVILTPQAMTEIEATAEIIPEAAKGSEKPIVASFMGLVDVAGGAQYLLDRGIPNYTFPEAAVAALGAMVKIQDRAKGNEGRKYREFKNIDAKAAHGFIAKALEGKTDHLMHENEANQVLNCYGMPLLKSQVITAKDQLKQAAEKIGFPLVMKVVSPQIVHKSDAGGVKVGMKDLAEAEKAYDDIMANAKAYDPKAVIEGIYVVEMAKKGVECIVGATRDPKFGPLIMFGLGGIMVEVMKDVQFRLAPMWESSAANMIKGIKAHEILKGVRGNPPSDVKTLQDCILRVSQMMTDNPEIMEMDINPMIVLPEGQGCVVADCRLILKKA